MLSPWALRILESIRILKLQKKLSFIKLRLLKFLETQKHHKMKKHHSCLKVLMVLPNYMLTGQLLIIERLIISLHVMEYYLITRGQKEVKHL